MEQAYFPTNTNRHLRGVTYIPSFFIAIDFSKWDVIIRT
jgi:hypothetical protein